MPSLKDGPFYLDDDQEESSWSLVGSDINLVFSDIDGWYLRSD